MFDFLWLTCGFQCYSRFRNGARYTGSYTKGKKNDYGTFVYPDGSKYVGNWVNDEKQGFGTYYYVNGDIYEGDWYENKRHGQGKKDLSLSQPKQHFLRQQLFTIPAP
jgi:hypothetical protein